MPTTKKKVRKFNIPTKDSAPLAENEAPPVFENSPKVKRLDSLIGLPLEGYEGKYWTVLPDDLTPSGFWLSGNNIRIPKTIHIPTGSNVSYKKSQILLDDKKTDIWEIHDADVHKKERKES